MVVAGADRCAVLNVACRLALNVFASNSNVASISRDDIAAWSGVLAGPATRNFRQLPHTNSINREPCFNFLLLFEKLIRASLAKSRQSFLIKAIFRCDFI